ncbi:MAG: PKD domain-containing protein, partial [Bacteroidales bacterium]|nr:PKD domain-containing protein [Bacteroidales bacterium]
MKRLFIISLLLCIGSFVHGQAVTFKASVRTGCVPLIVDFTCTSANVIYQEWDFGDGTPTSYVMDPSHTFYNAGTYSIKLKVRFQDNTEKDTTISNMIKVSAGPQISFTAAPDSVCPGEIVNFSETISNPGSIQSILWDFKDGGMSTSSKPSHAYANSGTYRPVLRV